MAIHLNEDKDQNVVFGSSFLSNPVLREGEEKGGGGGGGGGGEERGLGLGKDQVLGGVSSHFLLLYDQTTYKWRFKEAKVRKQNPSFIFCDFV